MDISTTIGPKELNHKDSYTSSLLPTNDYALALFSDTGMTAGYNVDWKSNVQCTDIQ